MRNLGLLMRTERGELGTGALRLLAVVKADKITVGK